MSRIIAEGAIRGAHAIVEQARQRLEAARADKGEGQKVEFPETAFFFPMANALLGAQVKTVGEAFPILEHAEGLLGEPPSDKLWLPYLGTALDAGIATLLAEEIITAIRYLYEEEPQPDCEGFFTDTILRTLGIQLVDGRMPGFAAIIGAAPDVATAERIVRDCQQRSLLTFVGSSSDGVSIIDQLQEAGIEMSWDTYIVPYGRDTISAIYPLNWAIRSAMTFGGIKPGEAKRALEYCRDRVFAFGLALGTVDNEKYATAAGAIDMGFPVIADTDIPQILPSGICSYEHVVVDKDYEQIVPTCVKVRGVKVKVEKVDIPVAYAAAFEGERVRKEDMQLQFGGKYTTAFELLQMADLDEIDDGKVELVGPECDSVEQGGCLPLAIEVKVAGRKMQKDFEPVMERHVHIFLNQAMGIFHMGQRQFIWVRFSKEAFKKGFRLRHLGVILHAKIHDMFGSIVDKVEVTIYTEEEKVKALLDGAMAEYAERDTRVGGMTDESVDVFYSCTLCQSFAPNHVCVISPERLGLCGAYNWLDGKAMYEIDQTGPNQPLKKGRVIDEQKGQWEDINAFVYGASNKTLEKFNAYSVMEYPMTSCGCFECIMAIVPEVNGFMIVNREYAGMTPSGMNFTTLAGSVGGGVQTPGFLGVGKLYILSKKFIQGDGGLGRLVWMPQELKEFLGDKLKARCEEIGMPDLFDKIATEQDAETPEQLMEYAMKVQHPALTMPSLF